MEQPTKNYRIWPLGMLPKKWQRPELDQLREAGYDFGDPREAVSIFEMKLATFAGSRYAIATDNCTNAIFLALKYLEYVGQSIPGSDLTVPACCYPSVPLMLKREGYNIRFHDIAWSGAYKIEPLNLYDGATRFTKGMYIPNSFYCCSFQIKKRLPIGKGGMIFTNDRNAVAWLKQARFEGRHEDREQWDESFEICGWNMYMTPEDAARGVLLFDQLPPVNDDTGCQDNYADLSTQKIFQ